MAWNGSGTFTRNNGTHTGATVWQQDRDAGANILASRMDTHDQDIADGLENCVARDGQNSPSADLPMNSQKHTGVANGDARNTYLAVGQAQDEGVIWGGTSGGSANAHTITLTPAITAYAAGQRFAFIPGNTNTGATTIDVNGVGAKSIKKFAADVSAGDLSTSVPCSITYDGTNFNLDTPLAPYLAGLTAVAAAGTTQGGATAISAYFNNCTTTSSNTGVVLPTPSAGLTLWICASDISGGALQVYPASGHVINNKATNTPVTMGEVHAIYCIGLSTTTWITTFPSAG